MSATVIKEFLVSVGMDFDKNSIGKFNSFLYQASKTTAGLAATLGIAKSLTIGGFFLFTQQVAKGLDDLNDLSKRINTTAGEIKELGYIAQISGSSTDIASASLEGLNKAAGDTALGIGRAKKIFEKIGVSVKDQDGKLKNTATLMLEIGNAIKGMEVGKQNAILERLGIDRTMLETLTGDVQGLRDEFNSMYDKDEINKAAKDAATFMDAFDRMRMKLKSVMISIASKFFVPFANGMDKLTAFVNKHLKQIIAFFAPFLEIIDKVSRAFTTLFGRVFSLIFSAISTFIGWIVAINDAFDGWLGKIALAVVAWRLLSAVFLSSPIGIIMALGLAILALLDDFLTWKEGGDSLFDWSDWMPFFNFMESAIDGLTATLRLFFDLLFETFGLANDLLHLNFSGAAGKVGMMGDSINTFAKENGVQSNIGTRYGLTPSPSAQAAVGANQTITQKTDIHVNGAGNPSEVAKTVAGTQSRVNDNMLRNMKGSAR